MDKDRSYPVYGAEGKVVGRITVPAGTKIETWSIEKISEVNHSSTYGEVVLRISPPE